jgi:hypothetical protein
MTPARRNLWLELAAIGLVLCSLLPIVSAGYYIAVSAMFILLPGEAPIVVDGSIQGVRELTGVALITMIFAATLIAIACVLSALVVEEREPRR